jgi:dTDP-4-dehydrorhamnose reductase
VRTTSIVAIKTAEYPTKAVRPLNSRLDLSRITALLGRPMPAWQSSLELELDQIVGA